LLVCFGFIGAGRLVNVAIANDLGFSTAQARSTSSAIGSLLVGNPSAEIGDAVFLNDVRLQAGPKPDLFVVSGAKGVRMLVSLESPQGFQFVPGSFDIKGTIRRLPTLEVLRKEWRLSKDEVHFFRKQQVYIAADYIREQGGKGD
jgi:hypothetical protein